MSLSISTSVQLGGAVLITVRGEVDAPVVHRLSGAINAAISEHRPTQIRLDLGLVTYLDSTGLGALLAGRKRANDEGVRLCVTDAAPAIRRVLRVGHLDLDAG